MPGWWPSNLDAMTVDCVCNITLLLNPHIRCASSLHIPTTAQSDFLWKCESCLCFTGESKKGIRPVK
jgi:hypothetical protein